MSTHDLATLTFDGRISTLALNRPDARNALSNEQLHALQDLGVGDEVAVAGGHLRLERVRRRLRPDGQQVHRVLVLPQRSRQHFRARF
jgi:hypothetical protein